MASFSSFQELDCWKQAVILRKGVRALTKSLPPEEKFRLADQLIRASRSAPANIAEGFGRYHYQENIQFCRHSRGSLNEVIDHLIVAREEEYINEEFFNQLVKQANKCINVLNGYVAYLHRAKANQSNNSQVYDDGENSLRSYNL